MIERTCFYTNKNILIIFGHFSANLLNHQKFRKIQKNAIFAKSQFFSICFICFHMMIYGMKCHLGTLKSHLKAIYDIHDVIRAFFGKSIFFSIFEPKNNFSSFLLMQKLQILQYFGKILFLAQKSKKIDFPKNALITSWMSDIAFK